MQKWLKIDLIKEIREGNPGFLTTGVTIGAVGRSSSIAWRN
jgi:hypothetical protein